MLGILINDNYIFPYMRGFCIHLLNIFALLEF